MTVETIVCICCPCGCDMEVVLDEQGSISSIRGNECARGLNHAVDEATSPTRVLTQCLFVPGVLEPLSVKTAMAIPKTLMQTACEQIDAASHMLKPPIKAGEVVVADVAGTGVPAIATKSIG